MTARNPRAGATSDPTPPDSSRLPNELRAAENARQSDAMLELLRAIPATGALVDLLKWSEQTAKGRPGYGLIATFPCEDFGVDMVRRKYGAGDYRVYIRQPDDPDATQRRDFIIHPQAVEPGAAAPAPAASGNGVGGGGFDKLLEAQGQVLKNLADSTKPQQLDLGALFTGLAALITALKPPAAPAAAGGVGDLDGTLRVARFLAGQRNEGGTSVRELYGVFKQGLEAAKDLSGPERGDALERLGLKFADLLDKMAEREAAAPPDPRRLQLVGDGHPPARPAPGGPPAGRRTPDPENPPPIWWPWVAPVMPLLMAAAHREDPDLAYYADLVLRQVPEAADPLLEDLMSDPEYPNNVLTELPAETAPAHRWLRQVLLTAKVEFDQGETEPIPVVSVAPAPDAAPTQ